MDKEKQQGLIKRHIPWWLYLFFAILSYSLFKFVIPTLASNQAGRERLTDAGSLAAPIVAIVFLLMAANALYKNTPESKEDNENEHTENDTP